MQNSKLIPHRQKIFNFKTPGQQTAKTTKSFYKNTVHCIQAHV